MTSRVLMGLLLLALGCGPHATAPTGFAPYKDNRPFRAVSPDGVLYRVKRTPNEPRAELSFWTEALERRQRTAGYKVVSTSEVKAGKLTGSLLELQAPQGAADYTYLIALFVDGDTLVIVEVAGEVKAFEGRRKDIMAAIEALPDGR